MSSHEIHSNLMFTLSALFGTHTHDAYQVMCDVYYELIDEGGLSLRAPDVVIAKAIKLLQDGPVRRTPILAVEIRATQSKSQVQEKVKLYLEHDWPLVWLVHADRQEIEVVTPGSGSVVYPRGTEVPLIPELDKYELKRIPVMSLFDKEKFQALNDGWVATWARARERRDERARCVLTLLGARSIVVTDEIKRRVTLEKDLDKLERWLLLAATAASAEAFEHGVSADPKS